MLTVCDERGDCIVMTQRLPSGEYGSLLVTVRRAVRGNKTVYLQLHIRVRSRVDRHSVLDSHSPSLSERVFKVHEICHLSIRTVSTWFSNRGELHCVQARADEGVANRSVVPVPELVDREMERRFIMVRNVEDSSEVAGSFLWPATDQ